ncbi:LOW QUALITY PROTEIN: ADP-ribosylation factor-like protein 6-interacting protein 4 [Salvelinus alpinus]
MGKGREKKKSSSSSLSSSSSSSSSSSDEKAKRKEKGKNKKVVIAQKITNQLNKEWKMKPDIKLSRWIFCFVHSLAMTGEQKARLSTKRPLTKEEYEAKQSVIRRVVDPETGCTRGEGEIIEEIVSKERHKEINKQATKGDGNSFQKKLGLNM